MSWLDSNAVEIRFSVQVPHSKGCYYADKRVWEYMSDQERNDYIIHQIKVLAMKSLNVSWWEAP